MKYTLQMVETDIYGKETLNNVTFTFHADTLSTMLEKYQDFLRGCGFYFEGELDFVQPDDRSEYEMVEEHSEFFYDENRNRPVHEWTQVRRSEE